METRTIIGMKRNLAVASALVIAAATSFASGAWAENPNAAPQGKANAADKAADKTQKVADKAADKAEKATDKAADKADKAADKAKGLGETAKPSEDRAARRNAEHEALRAKLATSWKGPADEALRQELRRHGERIARLERIKEVASTDKDAVAKATTLIDKENDRHEKWMTKHAPTAMGTTTPAGATPTPAVDTKEGAK